MAYSRTITINGLAAGLTLKGALITGSTIHATFRDVAFTAGSSSGSYYLASSAWPDSYRGRLVLYTGTVGVASDFSGVTVYAPEIAINPEDGENLSGGIAPTAAQNAAAVRDVSNASPAAGSLGAMVAFIHRAIQTIRSPFK